jgi:hypothetical protein
MSTAGGARHPHAETDVHAEHIPEMVELDRDECLHLLAATNFGRFGCERAGVAPGDPSCHLPLPEITNVAEVHRLEQVGLRSLAPGDKPHWLRIRAAVVSGRRIGSWRVQAPTRLASFGKISR